MDGAQEAAAPTVDFDVNEANSVCIIGNVGADPVMTNTDKGSIVGNMSIALFMGVNKGPLWCGSAGHLPALCSPPCACRLLPRCAKSGEVAVQDEDYSME